MKQETAEEVKGAAEVENEAAEATGAEQETAAEAAENCDAEAADTEPSEESGESKQLSELKDKYARLYAEFDNYRKRTDKEKAQMYDMGARKVVEKLLPVVDNFERALQNVPAEGQAEAFADGVDRIYKQLMKTFEELDVRPIEALGSRFDPNLHNAVMTESESDAEEDTVTEDLQKGYTYKGDVIRYSMVKVKK